MVSKERAIECTRQCLEQWKITTADTTLQMMEDLRSGKSQLQLSQLCRLWAGMGSIYKVSLDCHSSKYHWDTKGHGSETTPSQLEFVIKHVTPPPRNQQSLGDRRKAQSYQVEANFYQHVAPQLLQKDPILIMPIPYSVHYGPKDDEITIAMSYLQASSSSSRYYNSSDNHEDVHGTLQWLAHFHASYWGQETMDSLVQQVGLQAVGSYWHLDTRPDEHASMSNKGWQGRLKRAAQALDHCLKRDPMQCLIHGDPKDANIMKLDSIPQQAPSQQRQSPRSSTNHQGAIIAMYDFQYCGKGTPTRDLAYYLCTSCDPDYEADYILYYHQQLCQLLTQKGITPPPTLAHFQQSMLLAFADFYRFLCGWGQWGYDLKDKVLTLLDTLDQGHDLGSEHAYHEAIQKEFW